MGERQVYFKPSHVYSSLLQSGLEDPEWGGEGKGTLDREEVAEAVMRELLASANPKTAPRKLNANVPPQLGARPFLQRVAVVRRTETGADGKPVLNKKGKPITKPVFKDGQIVLQLPPEGDKVFEIDDEARYVVNYEEDPFWQTVRLSALAIGVFIMLLYRVWPMWMRTGIWYVSVTFLVVFFGFIALRHSLFVVLWVFGIELWLIPGFWDDIYWPLYSLEFSPAKNVVIRLLLAVVLLYGGY